MAVPRRVLRLLPLVHDVAIAALAAAASLVLRVGWSYPASQPGFLVETAASFALVAAPVFLFTGAYRASWRFVSVREALALGRAAMLANLVYLPALFLATRLEALPRSFLVINVLVLTAALLAPRLTWRLVREGRIAFDPAGGGGEPVLIIGGGAAADLFLRALEGRAAAIRPVGILETRAADTGGRLRGVPVLGDVRALDDIIDALRGRGDGPRRLVVVDPDLSPSSLRDLVDAATPLGLSVARAPRPTDLQSGDAAILSLRPIAIEDLLGRPPAPLDTAPVRALIAGARVLVTGAGGSIGSELVRQIIGLGPADLTLIDASEFALYEIDREVAETAPALERRALLVDVRHRGPILAAIKAARPDFVFHAAALKHVPLVEANPLEGAATNVLGTRNVADGARAAGARAMVLISTDKAVNPSSIMGATKRLAEAYAQALDVSGRPSGTRFVTVRFGNVLGSRGSVVPLFERQLAKGGPLTVTHPDMRRYFMTIPEAVSLVLQAVASGMGDEARAGRIHVLDMGEQVRVIDLARQMIRLAGFEPDRDVRVVITGLRPGEKLEEELFHDAEPPVPTAVRGVLLAAPRIEPLERLGETFAALERAVDAVDPNAVLGLIRDAVPEMRSPVID